MEKILTLAEAKAADRLLINSRGLDERELVFGAASAALDEVFDFLLDKRVVIAVGPGNNGSDGLAMARLMSERGLRPLIYLFSSKGNPLNMALRGEVAFLEKATGITEADVIIDALFGFSFEKREDAELSLLVKAINESRAFVISLDLPSALEVRADLTITFLSHKLECYLPSLRDRCGRIAVKNPGFPPDGIASIKSNLLLINHGELRAKPFSSSDYKNSRGHLAIIGGSEKYPGAPLLSARAAFRSGAGLVTIISPSAILYDRLIEWPSVMRLKAEECDELSRFDSIVIGPGLGDSSLDILNKAIDSGKAIVIDADGLKLIRRGMRFSSRAILTPHIGEYRALCRALGIADGLESAESLRSALLALSELTEAVVVLKSSVVWVAFEGKIYIYDGSNPSLGVAGSGDALDGIIGTMTLTEPILMAALAGIEIHQCGGRIAHELYGYYSAEELIEECRR